MRIFFDSSIAPSNQSPWSAVLYRERQQANENIIDVQDFYGLQLQIHLAAFASFNDF